MSLPIGPLPASRRVETSESESGGPRGGGRRRRVARLAAVQALYQLDLTGGADPEIVVREFIRHRFGHEIEGDRYGDADPLLFADIVRGVTADLLSLDTTISAALTEEWPLRRLDAVLRAILRAGAYELLHRHDIPPRVSISEYTAIAHAFFSGKEPGMANGVLDKVGRTWRTTDI